MFNVEPNSGFWNRFYPPIAATVGEHCYMAINSKSRGAALTTYFECTCIDPITQARRIAASVAGTYVFDKQCAP